MICIILKKRKFIIHTKESWKIDIHFNLWSVESERVEKNKCKQCVYRFGMKKLGIFSWKPKMQSAVNCGWIRIFFCWVKIHCALFLSFSLSCIQIRSTSKIDWNVTIQKPMKTKIVQKTHTHIKLTKNSLIQRARLAESINNIESSESQNSSSSSDSDNGRKKRAE